MFTNLTHLPGITQAQHRALPHVSNTDLTRLADELLGRARDLSSPYLAAALTFGSHFHSAILEPTEYTRVGRSVYGKERAQWAAAGQLARTIKRHRCPRHVCHKGRAEQSYTATHTATGLLVKVRPDLLINSPQGRRRTLVDFKTTSCATLDQFLATIDKYGYDQQGALYADVLSAQRVVLIAVQKRPAKGTEPQVWVHELTAAQMQQGRKKYQKLLRCYAELRSGRSQQLAAYPLTTGQSLERVYA